MAKLFENIAQVNKRRFTARDTRCAAYWVESKLLSSYPTINRVAQGFLKSITDKQGLINL